MLSFSRPAVYKCIIPIFHMPLDGQSSGVPQELPFPAWPEIDDPHQPCCLIALYRATYFEQRGALVDPEKAAAIAEEHLSRQEGSKREIIEQAQAFVRAQNIFLSHMPEITRDPQVLFEPCPGSFLLGSGDPVQVFEVGMQALIAGNLENFYGPEAEAYGFAHEHAHRMGLLFASGLVLDHLSEGAQGILIDLATHEIPPEEIPKLWTIFWEKDSSIRRLVQKFEPVEEIVATYWGLRFSPIDVRNAITPLIKVELKKRNWDETYEAFVAVCDVSGPFSEAFMILEYVCLMILQFDVKGVNIDSLKLLCTLMEIRTIIRSYIFKIREQEGYKDTDEHEVEAVVERQAVGEINRALEEAGIPLDVYWYVSATIREIAFPERIRYFKAVINNDLSHEDLQETQRLSTRITLIGRPSQKEIAVFVQADKQENRTRMSPFERLLFESLRQQLGQDSGEQDIEIMCPYAYGNRKECCGYKEDLLRLYERLPDEFKKRFKRPDCGFVQ